MRNGRRLVAMAASVALIGLVCGCAIFQRGPSDEQLLTQMLAGWVGAMEEGSVETVLSFYSKNYMGAEGDGYDELEGRLEQIVPALEQFDAKLMTDETMITIEGDKATLTPITIDSSFGTMDLTLEATKEGGTWLITSTELQQ